MPPVALDTLVLDPTNAGAAVTRRVGLDARVVARRRPAAPQKSSGLRLVTIGQPAFAKLSVSVGVGVMGHLRHEDGLGPDSLRAEAVRIDAPRAHTAAGIGARSPGYHD